MTGTPWLALLVSVAACGPGGGAPERPSPSPSPTELVGASCEDQEGGDPEVFPDFVDVELETLLGVDRITFEFRQTAPDATDPPKHLVGLVDRLVSDAEGAPVEVEGDAFVRVSFQAVGVDLSGETPVEVYTGPQEFTPGFPTVLEVEQTGDFEGVVSWGIGLARRACPRVDATADALVVEFPSP